MFDHDVMNTMPRYYTKIYVASSWKNTLQPEIVRYLRSGGYSQTYDFKCPEGNAGFSWQDADPDYVPGSKIGVSQYRKILATKEAEIGYARDMWALNAAHICLLVLPAGKSASWEFGYAFGSGKKCAVIWFGEDEPDLMYRGTTIIGNLAELDKFMSDSAYVGR